jgi:hypothetical protein
MPQPGQERTARVSRPKARLATAALIALSGLLLLPAAGQAAQVFGSGFVDEPNQTDCESIGACSVVGAVEHPAEGVLTEAGSPIDGVITKVRIWARTENPLQISFMVANVRPIPSPEGPKQAMASPGAIGLPVTLGSTKVEEEAGEPPRIQEFPSRLPVKRGQHLGLNAPGPAVATHSANSDKFSYEFAPLPGTSSESASVQFLGELLIQATVEPDVDGDGFGDETQDKCPTQATTQGACDVTPPAVSGLSVTNGEVSYSLSEASTVSFTLEKKFVGRKLGQKCVKKTAKNRKKKKCSTFKPVGAAFAGTGAPGANLVAIPNGTKLKPGLYRLTMTARDTVGLVTVTTTTFKVAKKKKRR